MRATRYRIRFPSADMSGSGQDESYFTIVQEGTEQRLRFHDYADIYEHPGLYEQLFYERLKCSSPSKVIELLRAAVATAGEQSTALRVLDVGAGNGMVGELLVRAGVARLVAVDNIDAAKRAALRDRPGIYDAYYVTDLSALSAELHEELSAWHLDALITVAALGFGDIPVSAFSSAYNLVRDGCWIAFNIKETFLDASDDSGFSHLVKMLLNEDYLKLHRLERYCHRLSIEGQPLHYYAVVGQKQRPIPPLASGPPSPR